MEKIVHVYSQFRDGGWYLENLDEVNEELADGWKVKMISSHGIGMDVVFISSFIVLEKD